MDHSSDIICNLFPQLHKLSERKCIEAPIGDEALCPGLI